MALNLNKNLKQYYSIREVSEMFGVSESLLRFWETEFPMLKPTKSSTNVRRYTEADINIVRSIHNLVKVRGFKLAAARKMLQTSPKSVNATQEVLDRLSHIKEQLVEIRSQLKVLE